MNDDHDALARHDERISTLEREKGGLRSVLQGVESVVASFESSTEQKHAKAKLKARNIANDAEKTVSKELKKLGLSKGKKS